jgi:hypothetical protein
VGGSINFERIMSRWGTVLMLLEAPVPWKISEILTPPVDVRLAADQALN